VFVSVAFVERVESVFSKEAGELSSPCDVVGLVCNDADEVDISGTYLPGPE
jgi:hypothetical protein